ncbi:conserved Hypothetical protein CBG04553 [Streptosporangium roseum DSM 43021]|uniref:Uncharacterized protein n=1 Tax=Streptosporangium roseum (strain ATCC 12428 / DSM 43021 / JCM 3005 / KCTC 9067 / NCIMB 10171 / NRRL 2505 / NI 9100) TaxID=479432 RepID=D2BCQ2_STRRD|nr:conserved Hypothetical protein CBG04553 [Streptosporangium roseum DSM 43021]
MPGGFPVRSDGRSDPDGGGSPAATGGSTTGAVVGAASETRWSAMADHGWATIAPVVADTPARRRPETRVTRRDGLRGGMTVSSIYGVGSGPERGFQPAAVNSAVPGRATSGSAAGTGSGMLTQSPRPPPRMPECHAMSRLMAYGLE